jgi:hypothetical protein
MDHSKLVAYPRVVLTYYSWVGRSKLATLSTTVLRWTCDIFYGCYVMYACDEYCEVSMNVLNIVIFE